MAGTMRNKAGKAAAAAVILVAAAIGAGAEDRFRLEAGGGVMFLNPRDLNLLSKAEEQYNYLFFQERFIGVDGYFTNDFPRIFMALPALLRLRCRLNRRFDASVEVEAFRSLAEDRFSGTFEYGPRWKLRTSKAYDPFRLETKAISVLGGLQFRIPAGEFTELELGAAAGWTWAAFDFRSTWTTAIDLTEEGWVYSSSVDGATLEGDGRGSAPAAKLMLRLNRALGRRLGLFVETSAAYCRIKSLSGGGRETRLSIPGETAWEGTWAIKKEAVVMPYDSAEVLVPTNYWEGWTAGQRDRDFALDLSGLRLIAGFYLKF